MILRTRRGRRLGTIATPVSGSLVYSSNPVSTLRRPVPVRSSPVPTVPSQICPPWGCNGPQNWYGLAPGSQPSAPASSPQNWYGPPSSSMSGQSLATAQALLQTNPGLLTAAQWQLLQQAGLVANTLPYSSAPQVTPTYPSSVSAGVNDPNCLAAGMTGGPYPNCTAGAAVAAAPFDISTALSTDYAGLPLYLWLGGGLAAYLLFFRQRGRR